MKVGPRTKSSAASWAYDSQADAIAAACCKNAIGVSAVQIVEVVEHELKKAWESASTLRYHVLRYGPAGYDITRGWNAVEIFGVDGEGVLVTDGNEYAVASRHCGEWFECATERPLTFAPTHWMDLPDFPSESNAVDEERRNG